MDAPLPHSLRAAMTRTCLAALLFPLLACATISPSSSGGRALPEGVSATVELNGVAASVIWTDGDTFVFADGPRRGGKARLMGVNTLETYGPVHRWGSWDRHDLLELALASAAVAAEVATDCRSNGSRDKYKRLLVDCVEGRRELLRQGHGHLYPFDRVADPHEVAIQREAQQAKVGMWRGGVPAHIVTKVDAATAENGWSAANWMVSTKDGKSRREGHREEHQVCDEVCVGRPLSSQSCLLWVPYEIRYTNRPACLK